MPIRFVFFSEIDKKCWVFWVHLACLFFSISLRNNLGFYIHKTTYKICIFLVKFYLGTVFFFLAVVNGVLSLIISFDSFFVSVEAIYLYMLISYLGTFLSFVCNSFLTDYLAIFQLFIHRLLFPFLSLFQFSSLI